MTHYISSWVRIELLKIIVGLLLEQVGATQSSEEMIQSLQDKFEFINKEAAEKLIEQIVQKPQVLG